MAKLSGLIGRLSDMEDAAARIYWKASRAAAGDRELERLLQNLAVEEDGHALVLAGLSGYICSKASLAEIEVDEEAVDNAARYLEAAERAIDDGSLAAEGLVECVASTESSEWNREFLKVMAALRDDSRFFIPVVARMQQHKRSIERFLARRPGCKRHLRAMRSLPAVWEERLLVVDDDPAVAGVVSAVLEDEGTVDMVGNGAEALKKIESGYYAAIVSDYSMPLVNGRELLTKAEERYPGIRSRFVFFTSHQEGLDYFREKGVRALAKPSSVMEIAGAVASILSMPR